MADLFISYARADRDRVRPFAESLERRGFSVWWDVDIQPGRKFAAVLDDEIKKAKCIVVVWSQDSVQSDWVYEEAEDGRAREILIPVLIDEVEIPRGFRSLQAADMRFSDFSRDDAWEQLIERITHVVGSGPKPIEPDRGKNMLFGIDLSKLTAYVKPRARRISNHLNRNANFYGAVGSIVTVVTFVFSVWPGTVPVQQPQVPPESAASTQNQSVIGPVASPAQSQQVAAVEKADDDAAIESKLTELANAGDAEAQIALVTFRTGDPRKAVELFKQRSKGPDTSAEEKAESLRNLGAVSETIDWNTAVENYLKALELIPEDPRAMQPLAMLYIRMGNLTEARRLFQSLFTIGQTKNDAEVRGNALRGLGGIAQYEGNLGGAREMFLKSRDEFKKAGLLALEGTVLSDLGALENRRAIERLGSFDEAVKYLEEAVAIHQKISDAPRLALDRYYLGMALRDMGQLPRAQIELERALALYKASDDKFNIAMTEGAIGNILTDMQNLDAAIPHKEKEIALRKELSDRVGAMIALQQLAWIHLTRGNFALAEQQLSESYEFAMQTNHGYGASEAARLRAWSAQLRGDFQTACTLYGVARQGYIYINAVGPQMNMDQAMKSLQCPAGAYTPMQNMGIGQPNNAGPPPGTP